MYSDDLFQIISLANASTMLLCVMLVLFTLLLTYAKEKVAHPRLCFLGAVTFGLAFTIPVFAFVVNGLFSNGFTGSGWDSYGIISLIAAFAAPILFCISLMFLIFSLKPKFEAKKQIGSSIRGSVEPTKNPFE